MSGDTKIKRFTSLSFLPLPKNNLVCNGMLLSRSTKTLTNGLHHLIARPFRQLSQTAQSFAPINRHLYLISDLFLAKIVRRQFHSQQVNKLNWFFFFSTMLFVFFFFLFGFCTLPKCQVTCPGPCQYSIVVVVRWANNSVELMDALKVFK